MYIYSSKVKSEPETPYSVFNPIDGYKWVRRPDCNVLCSSCCHSFSGEEHEGGSPKRLNTEATMATPAGQHKELGKLSYEISPEALKSIVESGRLLEFANTVAASAASEIHAQIVDQVSRAAIGGASLGNGISIGASNVFEGGDFGTVPRGPKGPRPKLGVIFGGNALSHVVDVAAIRQKPG